MVQQFLDWQTEETDSKHFFYVCACFPKKRNYLVWLEKEIEF